MDLYIDFGCLESFFDTVWSNSEEYKDCIDIFSDMKVKCKCTKDEVIKLKSENKYFESWFKKFGTTGKNKYYGFEISNSLSKISKDFYITNSNDSVDTKNDKELYRRSIFLSSSNEKLMREIQNQNHILIGRKGEEIETLKKLHIEHSRIIQFAKNFGSVKCQSSWSKYCNELPISDIIIIDPYYFEEILEKKDSASEILLTIASRMSSPKSPINVKLVVPYNGNIDFVDEKNKLLKDLKEWTCEDSTLEVAFSDKFHDRHLLSNYFWIISGQGFNMKFDEMNEGVIFAQMSLARYDFFVRAKELISLINEKLPVDSHAGQSDFLKIDLYGN